MLDRVSCAAMPSQVGQEDLRSRQDESRTAAFLFSTVMTLAGRPAARLARSATGLPPSPLGQMSHEFWWGGLAGEPGVAGEFFPGANVCADAVEVVEDGVDSVVSQRQAQGGIGGVRRSEQGGTGPAWDPPGGRS